MLEYLDGRVLGGVHVGVHWYGRPPRADAADELIADVEGMMPQAVAPRDGVEGMLIGFEAGLPAFAFCELE